MNLESHPDDHVKLLGTEPNTYSPTFDGAYLFVSADKVTERYVFKTFGYGMDSQGFLLIAPSKNNKIFLSETENIDSDACADRSVAIFKSKKLSNAKEKIIFSIDRR